MSDLNARIEALAEQGIHRVGEAHFEKTHLDSTRHWQGSDLEGVINLIEEDLRKFPGVFGHSVSRTDGTHEPRDLLISQAASAPAAAPAEPEAPAEPAVDPSGLTASAPGQTATGRVGTPEDIPAPEAPAAPEGAINS